MRLLILKAGEKKWNLRELNPRKSGVVWARLTKVGGIIRVDGVVSECKMIMMMINN